MFVYDLAAGKETRLTHDATETRYNGHFDWVYEEEFGLAQAWNWSPDNRYIAYWQIDEHAEPVNPVLRPRGLASDVGPASASRSPAIRTQSRALAWSTSAPGIASGSIPGETGEFYMPRIYWTSRPDTLAVLTLNRAQNVLKLYFFDVTTGGQAPRVD